KAGSINAYPILNILRELRHEKSVKGVILEIDSGGGSAYASELIYKEILKLKKTKKVYAYFQNTAASGGYYLAAACDKINSNSLCITGSIGAIMIRPDLKGLYNKLGITKERIGFYPLREVYSEYGKLGLESRKFLEREIDRVKTQFYERVTSSRQKNGAELEKLAGGRVFSGEDFHKFGMVDSLGTLLDTVSSMKEDLKLKEIFLSYEPAVYSFRTFLQDFKFAIATVRSPENYIKNKINENNSELEYRVPFEIRF
ncbi:MAG: signal peptide peptidase SppA, partial [Leptospira sp.]|nr:signal peptide peptidase SppA [Leptospira sp.]